MSTSLDALFPCSVDTAEQMVKFGESLAPFFKEGDIIALVGDLGAGKTHLTKGFAQYFNYSDNVTSPTFGLIHEYQGTPIIHADLYRLDRPEELLSIGWDDYLERDAILIIEWADRFPELMPDGTHWIQLEHTKKGRTLTYVQH